MTEQTEATNQPVVLVVEDDQFLGELITTKLTKEGFNVHLATNGAEGLQKVQELKPGVVLLDIIMPEMDGFEVLKNVRSLQDEAVAQTPVIVLSNLGQESNIERALALGANDFLVKSNFTTDEITQKIRKVIG